MIFVASECAAEAAKWENISVAAIGVAAFACLALIAWAWRP